MKRYISILGLIFFVIIISLSLFVDFNLTNNGYVVKDDLVKKVVYTESQEKQTKDVLDLRGLNNAFVSIAQRVIPAVVSINTEKKVKISSRENPLEFFFFPFGRGDDKELERRFQGLGSGMIISSDGYIVTNKHVIDNVDKRRVQLTDKRTYEAEVVGFDSDTDIALLKIDAEGLPIVILGNSDNTEVGQWVLAIGSPLSPNLSSTVTAGIISGIGRNIDIDRTNKYSIENFIQTDAAINPGNSGGPLLNIDGEVIGINTAIMSGSGYSQGYAFAIPINIVKNVVSDLKGHGKVTRGYIGISIGNIQDTDDIMYSPKLEILYNAIAKDERLEVVGSFYRMCLEQSKGLEYADKIELPITHDEIMQQYSLERYVCWHGSAIIRKSMFEQIGLFQ